MLRKTLFPTASAALMLSALPALAWGWNNTSSIVGPGPSAFTPSYYGYQPDDISGGYYGGGHYREYYRQTNYHGTGVASMPPPVPGPIYPYYGYYPPLRQKPIVLYAPPPPAFPAAAVLITVTVPDQAEVWLEGRPTNQTGPQRQFVSPPLRSGREYSYELRAKWKAEGRDVEVLRLLTVHAGDRLNVHIEPTEAATPLPAPKPLPLEIGR